MINGIINVYKEKGYTSHDVVAKLRGILKQKKIGHTGTLDPDATGVLPVCLGNATKLCDMLTDKSKEYVAELKLGVVTDTQDLSGSILQEKSVNVSEEAVFSTVQSFVGEYYQIPPMYSALKVNGRKLYELAREGKVIERQARKVEIYAISEIEIAIPFIRMKVACSKGTYIRTLCHDIGDKLGCGASMNTLIRTKVGKFFLENAITLEQIQIRNEENTLSECVLATETVFENLPRATIKKEFRKLIDNGNCFFAEQAIENMEKAKGQQIRVYNDEDIFCGVYEFSEEKKCFLPFKMFQNGD